MAEWLSGCRSRFCAGNCPGGICRRTPAKSDVALLDNDIVHIACRVRLVSLMQPGHWQMRGCCGYDCGVTRAARGHTILGLKLKGRDIGEGDGAAASVGRRGSRPSAELPLQMGKSFFTSKTRCCEMLLDEWWEHVHTYIVQHRRNLYKCVHEDGVHGGRNVGLQAEVLARTKSHKRYVICIM